MSQVATGGGGGSGSGAPVLPVSAGFAGSTTLTQAGAALITTQYTQVTLPATNTHAAVVLPTNPAVGAVYILERINSAGGNDLYIFPQVGAQIDQLGANNPLRITCTTANPEVGIMLVATSSTTWKVIGLAGGYTTATNFSAADNTTLGSTTFIGALSISNGNTIGFTSLGTLLSTQTGPYGTWPILRGGNANAIVMVTGPSMAGETVNFPSSVGFPFPAALVPSGTTQTIDWTAGSSQIVDLTSTSGNLTLTLTNPTSGGQYCIKFIGKVARTVTFSPVPKFVGGSLVITAAAAAIDVIRLTYDGANYLEVSRAQNLS